MDFVDWPLCLDLRRMSSGISSISVAEDDEELDGEESDSDSMLITELVRSKSELPDIAAASEVAVGPPELLLQ